MYYVYMSMYVCMYVCKWPTCTGSGCPRAAGAGPGRRQTHTHLNINTHTHFIKMDYSTIHTYTSAAVFTATYIHTYNNNHKSWPAGWKTTARIFLKCTMGLLSLWVGEDSTYIHTYIHINIHRCFCYKDKRTFSTTGRWRIQAITAAVPLPHFQLRKKSRPTG